MDSRLGTPRLHFRELGSTNDEAKRLAERGAPHGLTVTADQQTAGRGRQGRVWLAPPRSALLVSVLARPVIGRHKLAPLSAALAVAETCELVAQVEAQIKWPNDIWITQKAGMGRKVSGILVEARPDQVAERSWLVVGIGLNTSVRVDQMPPELQPIAASLELPDGYDALTPLIARLEHWLTSEPAQTIDAWNQRNALLGQPISWSEDSGTAGDVDEHGNLRVTLSDGSQTTLAAGEVHLSRG